jgi:NAD(P)-dependent dehydrogenase (short-subunit alcohol dehydrogenase family)
VIGITKAAVMEWATAGIRVNAVCPGVTRTPMAVRSFVGREEAMLPLYLTGRFGTPEEVAESVVWLCSSASSFITGHHFAFGWRLRGPLTRFGSHYSIFTRRPRERADSNIQRKNSPASTK